MGRISISIPDAMSDYVDGQVRDGGYESVDAFFHDLVLNHQGGVRRLTMDELRERLDRAAASGVSGRTMPEIFEEAKRRAALLGILAR